MLPLYKKIDMYRSNGLGEIMTIDVDAARCDELHNNCICQLPHICDNLNTCLKNISNEAESLKSILNPFHSFRFLQVCLYGT